MKITLEAERTCLQTEKTLLQAEKVHAEVPQLKKIETYARMP